MLSKSLIQFSVDGWGCVPSLLFDLRPNYGGGNEDNGHLLPKVPWCTAALSAPTPQQATVDPRLHQRLLDTQAGLGQSPVGSLLLCPGSWCTQGSVCALPESVSPVLCMLCNQISLTSKVKYPEGSQSFCQIPRLGSLLWVLELSQQCKNLFGIIVL